MPARRSRRWGNPCASTFGTGHDPEGDGAHHGEKRECHRKTRPVGKNGQRIAGGDSRDSEQLGAPRYGAMITPVAEHGAESGMFEQFAFERRRGAAEEPCGQNEEDGGRHHRQEHADESQHHHHQAHREHDRALCVLEPGYALQRATSTDRPDRGNFSSRPEPSAIAEIYTGAMMHSLKHVLAGIANAKKGLLRAGGDRLFFGMLKRRRIAHYAEPHRTRGRRRQTPCVPRFSE